MLDMKGKRAKSHPREKNNSGIYAGIRGYIALLPQLLGLVVNLLRDTRVSSADKAILGATVAYILNPVDLVPDWIPFAGLVDDVYLVALALLRLILRVDEQVLKDNWRGRDDMVLLLRKMADVAAAFLPARIRRSIFAKVER
ncbi:MAG: hypothetical protein DRP28_02445 [Thermodesulfobacteriota bacterium]|nr:MAG: hypothetical protein DRP28_02445 [Thermodesulfobacteriota bacterium]